jgi:DnaA family protein
MEQLSLEVRLADHALFDTFFDGANAAAAYALRDLLRSRVSAVLWLWGPVETGKTHLLQACVNAADEQTLRAAYLPLGPDSELRPEALDGMGELDVVCIDDVDAIAGNGRWEQALFLLFEGLRQRGARLILAAQQAPLHCNFRLPDLASRFSSGATFRLRPLSDEDKLKAMQLRAVWRGLELPDDTARYLLARVDRSFNHLLELLDQLDRKALAAQKKLTVPFVKSVLEK